MTKGNFIMLANKTLYNHLESGDTYIKNISDKITYILSYLDCKTDRMGKSNFSIEDMVLCSGLKVDTHKGKSVDQFRQVLKLMQDKGFLEDVEVDFLKVKPKDYISCVLNKQIPKDENGDYYWFFELDTELFLKLFYNTKTKNNKINLLNVYCYLFSRMTHYDDSDICLNGGANVCFPNRDTMLEDLGIKSQLLDNCLKELKDLGLIVYDNIGYVQKDKKVKIANNVYSTDITYLKSGLKKSKEFYKNDGWKVLNKKTQKIVRQLNGTKGAIKKLNNEGKDTSKLEKKKERLEYSLAK